MGGFFCRWTTDRWCIYRSSVLEMVFLHSPSYWWVDYSWYNMFLYATTPTPSKRHQRVEEPCKEHRHRRHSHLSTLRYMLAVSTAMGWLQIFMGGCPHNCTVYPIRFAFHCILRQPTLDGRGCHYSAKDLPPAKHMVGLHLFSNDRRIIFPASVLCKYS